MFMKVTVPAHSYTEVRLAGLAFFEVNSRLINIKCYLEGRILTTATGREIKKGR